MSNFERSEAISREVEISSEFKKWKVIVHGSLETQSRMNFTFWML